MTNQKFKIGDLVKLKSGGMTMTINKDKEWNAAKGVYNYEKVHCAWFDEKNKINKQWFNVDALVIATSTD